MSAVGGEVTHESRDLDLAVLRPVAVRGAEDARIASAQVARARVRIHHLDVALCGRLVRVCSRVSVAQAGGARARTALRGEKDGALGLLGEEERLELLEELRASARRGHVSTHGLVRQQHRSVQRRLHNFELLLSSHDSRLGSMLQGRSRTLLGRLAQLLPGKHFSIGSSKDLELPIRLFRTSSAARKDPAPAKLSKAALAEKQKKLERKRETRAVRRLEADAKGMESKVQLLQARLEVRDKADTAQVSSCPPSLRCSSTFKQLADGLAPFSEEELDGMYRGLITAPPEELSSVKAIASPEQSLLLGAPGPLDAESRGERMSELEERLAERVEGADPVEGAELSLGERLKLRRKGVDTVEPVAKGDAAVAEDKESVVDAPGVEAAAQSKSAATILRRLEVIIEQAEGEGSSPLVRVPLGVAVRSEWRDLILSCVSRP